MNPEFQQYWEGMCGRLSVQRESLSFLAELLTIYGERDRAYHNLDHIEHCLDEFEQVGFLLRHSDAVEFALWYHDAVYDPRRTDNEDHSATLAALFAKRLGLGDEFIEKVRALILATKHVTAPEDHDERFMVDIDLAIFGQSEAVFDEYERKIRLEFAHVSEADFCRGRAGILQMFLDRPHIFSTLHFRSKYEEQARKNLVRARNLWQRP